MTKDSLPDTRFFFRAEEFRKRLLAAARTLGVEKIYLQTMGSTLPLIFDDQHFADRIKMLPPADASPVCETLYLVQGRHPTENGIVYLLTTDKDYEETFRQLLAEENPLAIGHIIKKEKE